MISALRIRVTIGLLVVLTAAAINTGVLAAPGLVINEILINEPGSETALEWIELINTAPEPVDLARYILIDGKDTSRFATRIVDSESFVVLSRKPIAADSTASFESYWGNGSGVWGDAIAESYPLVGAKFSLRNSSDTLKLVSIQTGAAEVVSWRSSPPDGVSLERINWAISPRSSNFAPCRDSLKATPGRANSVVAPEVNIGIIEDSLEVEVPEKAGAPVQVRVAVSNTGLKPNAIELVLTLDSDRDGRAGESDWKDTIRAELLWPDSVTSFRGELAAPEGRNRLWFVLGEDGDSSDNMAALPFYLNADFRELQITEFLPLSSDSGGGEWLEVENVAGYPVLLQGWSVWSLDEQDSVAVDAAIAAGERAVVCADSVQVADVFGDLGCMIIELKNWPVLDDAIGNLLLINDFGMRIDSLRYDAPCTPDRSWERDPDSSGAIFSHEFYPCSDAAGATPCRPNSIRVLPPSIDLGLQGNKIQLGIDSLNPLLVRMDFLIVNFGRLSSPTSTLTIFDDRNRNQENDPSELLLEVEVTSLVPGDSVRLQPSLELNRGRHWLRARLTADEVPGNNEAMAVVTVGAPTGEVQISEFLADPEGDLESEWVELRSNVDYPVRLERWFLGDETGASLFEHDVLLMPGEYLVLSQDSSGFENFYECGCAIVQVTGWRNLNNGGDVVLVRDEFGHLVDSVRYANGHGGNRSWELNEIEDRPGVVRWFGSIDTVGATPCRMNSVSRELPELDRGFGSSTLAIERSERGEVWIRVRSWIKNYGRLETPAARFSLFDDVDGDHEYSEAERLADVAFDAIGVYDSLEFAGEVELRPGRHRLLALLESDDMASNDSAFGEISTGSLTREIRITEFLAAPEDGLESEWIEICNVSELEVSCSGWQIGDSVSQSAIVGGIDLVPEGYLVVVQDSLAFRNFYGAGCQVLEVSSWRSLNNDGDDLILRDEFGTLIDSVSFLKAPGENRSLELNETDGQRWYVSTAESGSTPCVANSVSGPIAARVDLRLEQRVFAPSQEELLTIQITCPPATPLTIEVFDLAGRRHRTLAEARPFSSGEIQYDGASDYFQRLPIGAYILKVAAEDGSGFETKVGFAVAAGR